LAIWRAQSGEKDSGGADEVGMATTAVGDGVRMGTK